MKIGGIPHRTIWVEPDGWSVGIIDQTRLQGRPLIVMISAIHLLRAFMNEPATDRLMVLAGVHLVFVASALLLAFVDKIGRSSGAH
jgi:uncharacterized protein (TIGR00645 family)